MYREVIRDPMPEQATLRFGGKVVDETGAALAAADLTTLTLTLYNIVTGTIINGRNDQNILNTNGGEVDASGNFSLTLGPNDMAIENAELGYEWRMAQLKWTYSIGTKTGIKLVQFHLVNLAKIT